MPVFDATLKSLVESHPADWVRLLGADATHVEVIDADLSAVSAQADCVILVHGPQPWLLHLEFQSGPSPDLDRRVLRYSVGLHHRFGLPVRSAVIALRRQALLRENRAAIRYSLPGARHRGTRLDFCYEILRLWELPAGELLSGGLGVLPLAPLARVGRRDLPDLIEAMEHRVSAEAAPGEEADLWTAAYILMGLRYPPAVAELLQKRVATMRESSTYQVILQEGLEKGREEGREEGRSEALSAAIAAQQRALLTLGERRFGSPSPAQRQRVESIRSVEQLEHVTERLLDVNTWDELLQSA